MGKKNKSVEESKDNKYYNALEKKFSDLEKELKDARESSASKEAVLKFHKALHEQSKLIEKFENQIKDNQITTTLGKFKLFLIENKDNLERIKQTGKGEIKFEVKAVGSITTGSGVNEDPIPANREAVLGDFNLRNDNDLLNLCTVTQTDRSSHVYTDLIPKDGDFTFVAEGGKKPQLDFEWKNRTAVAKKVAGHTVLTEESVTDISRLMTVAESYLVKKHDLKKVDGIFFGDGIGENPTGATTLGRTFNAGSMALSVDSPTIIDVVNAIGMDLYMTRNYEEESPYSANITMLNPVDYYIHLISAKDNWNNSMYPQANALQRVTIGGNTIIPWINIPQGKIFVADMTKYNVSNYIPFSIRIGEINENFIHNQFVMLGESRFFSYVKELDKSAFIYDDISVVKTAITKL